MKPITARTVVIVIAISAAFGTLTLRYGPRIWHALTCESSDCKDEVGKSDPLCQDPSCKSEPTKPEKLSCPPDCEKTNPHKPDKLGGNGGNKSEPTKPEKACEGAGCGEKFKPQKPETTQSQQPRPEKKCQGNEC